MINHRMKALLISAGILVAMLALAACMAPQSAVFGQTAHTGIGRGNVAVAVSPAFRYQRSISPKEKFTDGSEKKTLGSTFVGHVEGNFNVGLSERLGLNLHLSPAGFQPGLKVLLLNRWVSIAVLPEFAFLVSSYNVSAETKQASGVTKTETTTDSQTVGVTVGTKVIASTAVGLYGGFGYDFQYLAGLGDVLDTGTSNHIIGFALGYEWKLGSLLLRPELAFSVTVDVTTSETSGGVTTSQGGGYEWSILPNVSLALETGRPEAK